MSNGVRETICTRCVHREVCIYKETYLQYLQALEQFNEKYATDISFLIKEDPACKFLTKKPDVKSGGWEL